MPSREVANGDAAEEEPARRRRPRGVVANEEDEHARRESESSVQKVNSNPAHVGYFKFKLRVFLPLHLNCWVHQQ